MTREEVAEKIARDLYEWDHCDFIHAREDEDGYVPFLGEANQILDWLDEIGYYNMHFYGVATTSPIDLTGPSKE